MFPLHPPPTEISKGTSLRVAVVVIVVIIVIFFAVAFVFLFVPLVFLFVPLVWLLSKDDGGYRTMTRV
jgi:hypothetical protein